MHVSKYLKFEDLPVSHREFFSGARQISYDYSLDWYQNFACTAIDHRDEICIYGAETSGESHLPVALLPMRSKRRSRNLLTPNWLSSLSNFYTITFGPLAEFRETNCEAGLQALVNGMCFDNPRWDCIELRPMDPNSFVYGKLVRAFQIAGMVVQTYFCFGNWYLPVQGLSFDAYFKTLPSAMQNTIRRKTKKLEKSGRARILIAKEAKDIEEAARAYEKVYLSSWKRPEPYPEFIPGLIRLCSDRNWLRMGVVYLDEQPIAAQLWIVHGSNATIYKLAHDERYDEFSAGSILTTHLIQHVLEIDKVKEIDFGSGDDPYKKTWLPDRRERWGILAMNPRTLRGSFVAVRHIGGRIAKRAWQFLPRPGNQARGSVVR